MLLGKSIVSALLRKVEDVTGQNTIFRKSYKHMFITTFPNVNILDIVNSDMCCIRTFLSTTDRIYDSGPIILHYILVLQYNITVPLYYN